MIWRNHHQSPAACRVFYCLLHAPALLIEQYRSEIVCAPPEKQSEAKALWRMRPMRFFQHRLTLFLFQFSALWAKNPLEKIAVWVEMWVAEPKKSARLVLARVHGMLMADAVSAIHKKIRMFAL